MATPAYRIAEIALRVKDLEKMTAFYQDCLLYTSDAADD